MKITKSQVNKMTISGIPNRDTINVFMENFHPGAGRMTIEITGDSWSHYWSHMGEKYTLETFVSQCDNDYIIRKLDYSIDNEMFDSNNTERKIQKAIIKQRRGGEIEKKDAREIWDRLDELDDFGNSEHCPLIGELYAEHYSLLPSCPNPKYEYLNEVVQTIKEAIAQDVA